MISLNLNKLVKVKLTEKGKDILIKNYQTTTSYSYDEIEKSIEDRVDVSGFYNTTLWRIASEFGKHIFNGVSSEVIEGDILFIKEDPIFDYDNYTTCLNYDMGNNVAHTHGFCTNFKCRCMKETDCIGCFDGPACENFCCKKCSNYKKK